MRLAYDFEANGLFADMIRPGDESTIITKVHSLAMIDIDTGEARAYYNARGPEYQPQPAGTLREGVAFLLTADKRYAHNGSTYDERVLREFFPDLHTQRNPASLGLDTEAAMAAIWPTEHLRRLDAARIARAYQVHKAPFPKKLVGRRSLEAWGTRLGNRKGEYTGGWAEFNPAMLTYNVQDVATLRTLVQKIDAKIQAGHFTERAWVLEQDFKVEIVKQTINGFAFDFKAADALTATLQIRRAELVGELAKLIPPFENTSLTDPKVIENAEARVRLWEGRRATARTVRQAETFGAKVDAATATLEEKRKPKIEIVPFNPGSGPHIARHLMERHGWKPNPRGGYTEDGAVKVDESVLEGLRRYPHVDQMIEYKVVAKVLSMLAEPKKKDGVPWVKMAAADGRIHGIVDHNGAVTSRCTHRKPNMTQVPKVGNPYGAESRGCFVPSKGNVLVGVDASGLELRMLAHYLFKYDGGEYMRAVTVGDVHTKNQKAVEIPDGPTARDTAKRTIYAELYGAGEEKLGRTIDPMLSGAKAKARGHRAKASLLANTTGLRALKERTATLHKTVGSVNLPDGRRAWTRADYSALNTLLQASGAIVMKLAVVLMHRKFREEGLAVKQVHQAHDEVQLDVRPEIADRVKAIGCWAIEQAGAELGIKCPLKGEAKVGTTWAATH